MIRPLLNGLGLSAQARTASHPLPLEVLKPTCMMGETSSSVISIPCRDSMREVTLFTSATRCSMAGVLSIPPRAPVGCQKPNKKRLTQRTMYPQ